MEKFIFPDDPKFSRPFHFADENQPNNARIGGAMPEDLVVPLNDNAEYFGTFPLYENQSHLYFSLFINCSFEALLSALNRGFQADNRIVVVPHEEKPRGKSTKYSSKLSQHALQIGDLKSDMIQNDSGESVIREGHKFGGRPFCIQEPILEGSEELFIQRYNQLLQIDFPVSKYDGKISGSWPFGDGIFNLFWKYPFENEKYYWYLQG
jgi:hypothetical protein